MRIAGILILGIFFFLSCQKEMYDETPAILSTRQEISPPKEEIPITPEINPPQQEEIQPEQKNDEEEKNIHDYSSFLSQKEKELDLLEKALPQNKEKKEDTNIPVIEDLKKDMQMFDEFLLVLARNKKHLGEIQGNLEKKTFPKSSQPFQEKLESLGKKLSSLKEHSLEIEKKYKNLEEITKNQKQELQKKINERMSLKDSMTILSPLSLKHLMEKCSSEWKSLYPSSNLKIQYSHNDDMQSQVEKEKFSLIFSWIPLEDSTIYSSSIIAFDALSIAVFYQNPLEKIEIEDLSAVYAGEKKSWQDIGSSMEGDIEIYGWEANTFPFSFFSKILPPGKIFVAGIQIVSQEEEMLYSLSRSPKGIGYIRSSHFSHTNIENLKTLKIGNYTIKNGHYPLRFPLYCFNKQETEAEKKIQKFLEGIHGKKILKESGFLVQ